MLHLETNCSKETVQQQSIIQICCQGAPGQTGKKLRLAAANAAAAVAAAAAAARGKQQRSGKYLNPSCTHIGQHQSTRAAAAATATTANTTI